MYEKYVWKPKEPVASMRLNNMEQGIENALTKESDIEMQKISSIDKQSLTGMTSGWVVFSGSKNKYIDGTVVSTLDPTNVNSGLMSPIFDSDNEHVKIDLQGIAETVPALTIQLVFRVGTTWNYEKKVTFEIAEDRRFDYQFQFSATWYKIYKNANAFRVLINNGSGVPSAGTITMTKLEVIEQDIEQLSIYDPYLVNILQKIDARLPLTHDDKELSYPFISSVDKKFKIRVDDNGVLSTLSTLPKKALFMGNSLLLGINQGTHGTERFGMCASSSKADFFGLTKQAILAKNPDATFTKLHVGALETGTKESDFTSYMTTNDTYFESDLDLIVLQIGDNLNTTERIDNFVNIFPELIKQLETKSPNARVVMAATYFGNVVQPIMSNLAYKYGVEIVPLGDLNTLDNRATKGMTITFDDGTTTTADDSWITHPGDNGHKLIAERIIKQLNM